MALLNLILLFLRYYVFCVSREGYSFEEIAEVFDGPGAVDEVSWA